MNHVDKEFSEIYESYYSRMKKLCYGYTRSLELSEDLVQETFLSAWKHWDSFKGQSSRTTWIYRIAVNKCLSYIQKSSYKNEVLKEQLEHAELVTNIEEDIQHLYNAINQLEKVDRLLISMYLDELAYREIADVLGMKENAVAVRMHRIKKQLTIIFNRNEKL